MAALIGSASAAAIDIFLQWLEHLLNKKTFAWESYDAERTLRKAVVGGAVGAGIGTLFYKAKLSEEAKRPFNPDKYLQKVLSKENLKSDPTLLKKYLYYRRQIKEWLNRRFEADLVYKAEDVGSFFKRTAIAANCDVDMVLPFKSNSYHTLEQMYDDVYDALKIRFGDNAIVTRQTKAIGLTFEHNKQNLHFDIVPGREVRDYKTTTELHLYVRPNWFWQKGSSFKTNIRIQKYITAYKPTVRRIIKLLKTYKARNGVELPSLIIEQCVVEELSDRSDIDSSDIQNLLNCMTLIAKRLQQQTYLDFANSNNNLNTKLSKIQRDCLAQRLYDHIENIEKNPRYIKEIFDNNY